jgi:anaerobic selenocysteine-containing dehydrogenase
MKTDRTQKVEKKQKVKKTTRRKFLKKTAVAGAAALTAPALFNIRTAKAKTTTTDFLVRWYRTRDL